MNAMDASASPRVGGDDGKWYIIRKKRMEVSAKIRVSKLNSLKNPVRHIPQRLQESSVARGQAKIVLALLMCVCWLSFK